MDDRAPKSNDRKLWSAATRRLPLVLLLLLVVVWFYQRPKPSSGERDRHALAELFRRHATEGNRVVTSFGEAKKILRWVYQGHRTTFYCDCGFDVRGRIDRQLCPLPRDAQSSDRSRRLEWEHLVAVSSFGKAFPGWRRGSPQCFSASAKPLSRRACARRLSPEFARIEADLYNLVPAVGSVNQARGNRRFVGADGGNSGHQQRWCQIIMVGQHSVIPDERLRGWIARAHLYMASHYPEVVRFADTQLTELLEWNERYPPDRREREVATRIQLVQGNENLWITRHGSLQ